MVQLPSSKNSAITSESHCNLLQFIYATVGYASVSTGRHGKLTMAYTLKFTLIYKIAIQLLSLHLQGVQIFQFRNVKLTSGEPYVLITNL